MGDLPGPFDPDEAVLAVGTAPLDLLAEMERGAGGAVELAVLVALGTVPFEALHGLGEG